MKTGWRVIGSNASNDIVSRGGEMQEPLDRFQSEIDVLVLRADCREMY